MIYFHAEIEIYILILLNLAYESYFSSPLYHRSII